MANLKGSKTESNLMAAFAGESMARNKYTYYASKAKKDGQCYKRKMMIIHKCEKFKGILILCIFEKTIKKQKMTVL